MPGSEGSAILLHVRQALVVLCQRDEADEKLARELLQHGFTRVEIQAMSDLLPGPADDNRLLADELANRVFKLARQLAEPWRPEDRPAAAGKGKGRGERHPAKTGRGRW